jgi:hypothetical protein
MWALGPIRRNFVHWIRSAIVYLESANHKDCQFMIQNYPMEHAKVVRSLDSLTF